jgi:DNA-binding transcriptional MerR regulator
MRHDAALIETYYEPADCGRELGVTSAAVRRLTDRGVLMPAARTLRGTRLYRREDVLRVAERRRERAG